jgi:cytoskeletal protein CcmA (bactofilin family)
MLGKTKGTREGYENAEVSAPAGARTIIGEKISVEGGIHGGEDLVIEGSVKGSIELEKHHLTVGPKGHVEAEIHANNVTISGQLVGNIKALGKVEITKEADFNGEIKAKRIAVEDGAYLKAVIELEREPRDKGIAAIKPTEQTTPSPTKEPITLAKEVDKGK